MENYAKIGLTAGLDQMTGTPGSNSFTGQQKRIGSLVDTLRDKLSTIDTSYSPIMLPPGPTSVSAADSASPVESNLTSWARHIAEELEGLNNYASNIAARCDL